MGAFSEGFMAGLANPKATQGIVQAGSAFYDWLRGEHEKNRANEAFRELMKDNGMRQDNQNPFGYFDQSPPSGEGQAPQGPDRARIESEKMLKQLEQDIQRFIDSGDPRKNPQQYFNQPVTPRGRHVDPAYNRRR